MLDCIDPNCPGANYVGCPENPDHDPSLVVTRRMVAMGEVMDALTHTEVAVDYLEELTGESMDDVLDALKAVTEMIKGKRIPLS